ncbi:MAG TPA: GGDEF domain-containing protein [Myxococcota bacterium]|nr:GGDEF domain-containing protein [Myxococcota bacterium]
MGRSRNKTVITVVSKVTDRNVICPAALVMIYGTDLGRRYSLEKPEMVIGRSAKCDIQIDQESVSRMHAKILVDSVEPLVKDLGSTNGTLVNDLPIHETRLRNQDYLKIGRTIFKFLSGNNVENLYHDEIYRLTTVDGLTQVYNKRYFMETLDREMSRCQRYGRDLSLVLFDIDHFKQINDTFGHLTSDYVLKELAGLVKANIRREDFLARYGGEEFAIVLPEIDKARALVAAEKIRVLVGEHAFVCNDERIPVAVSLGVAAFDPQMASLEEFLRLVDKNLYEAKSQGRNRVVG